MQNDQGTKGSIKGGLAVCLALFKIAKVTKHRIDRKEKKKKSGWTDGTRKGFDDQNVVANCYFIPWTVSTSNSTRSTFRRGLRRRILPPPPPPSHRENAVQPMNDWELERGIRFALQEIPDNFARLSDERPLFAILLLVKMFHENDRTAARSVFVVQKESGRGL